MLLLVVWIAVAVAAVVVLGAVAYGLFGSFQRLRREMAALDRELRPVLAQVGELQERTSRTDDRGSGAA